MSKSEALTPVVLNQTISAADMEYSIELPIGTKHFTIRSSEELRFAFAADIVANATPPYLTLKSGDSYSSPEKTSWSGS